MRPGDDWKVVPVPFTDGSFGYDVTAGVLGGQVIFHAPSAGFAERLAFELNNLRELWVDAELSPDQEKPA